MGPLLVLVSPCFREKGIATCKTVSFWFSLINCLLKNVIVFCFGSKLQNGTYLKKRAIFYLLFTFSSHQGKDTEVPLAHISLTYILIFCSPYWLFLPPQFCKNCEFAMYGFSLVRLLVLILICPILEQSINNKIGSKFKLECLLRIFVYTNAKFIVICKPQTLTVGEDSVQCRKCKKRRKKKKLLLSSSHFAFYR